MPIKDLGMLIGARGFRIGDIVSFRDTREDCYGTIVAYDLEERVMIVSKVDGLPFPDGHNGISINYEFIIGQMPTDSGSRNFWFLNLDLVKRYKTYLENNTAAAGIHVPALESQKPLGYKYHCIMVGKEKPEHKVVNVDCVLTMRLNPPLVFSVPTPDHKYTIAPTSTRDFESNVKVSILKPNLAPGEDETNIVAGLITDLKYLFCKTEPLKVTALPSWVLESYKGSIVETKRGGNSELISIRWAVSKVGEYIKRTGWELDLSGVEDVSSRINTGLHFSKRAQVTEVRFYVTVPVLLPESYIKEISTVKIGDVSIELTPSMFEALKKLEV